MQNREYGLGWNNPLTKPGLVISEWSRYGDRFEFLRKNWKEGVAKFSENNRDALIHGQWLKGLTDVSGFGNILVHQNAVAMLGRGLAIITGMSPHDQQYVADQLQIHNDKAFFRFGSEAVIYAHFASAPWFNLHPEIPIQIVDEMLSHREKHVFRCQAPLF